MAAILFPEFFVSQFAFAFLRFTMNNLPKSCDRISEIFMRYGIKSITMDDIARELGISKKTLYQHFDNKKDLVKKSTQFHIAGEQEDIEAISKSAENAIDEMVQISRYIKRKLAVLSPTTLFDFRKYYPESWQVFLDHKVKYIYNCIASNLERGIQEGLYREDLDVDVLAKIYVARLEIFADNEVFPFHKLSLIHI